MKIDIRKLHKQFGKQIIFDCLDLSIEGRGIQGLMGSNGSGKTTLMRMVAGLDRHYLGDIRILDHTGEPIPATEITYVSPYPYMLEGTVYDNIVYPLKLRHWSAVAIEARASTILSAFGIEDLKDKIATRLSAGETQKTALARALAFRPKVLLLDEPTANIDRDSVLAIEAALRQNQEQEDGLIIAITHHLEQAQRFCHKVYELKDHRIALKDDEV